MLDLKLIREQPEKVKALLARRNGNLSIGELIETDRRHRQAQAEWEELNRRSNEISQMFKQGSVPAQDMEPLRAETRQIKRRREGLEALKHDLESALEEIVLSLPNLPDESVPPGVDETANLEVKRWGDLPQIENPRHHWELGAALRVFDFQAGVKLAESRFTVLLENGAYLERALINFMLDAHRLRGYKERFPPILVNRECLVGTGQLPKFEGEFYKCQDDDLYLIPTAEVPLTNLYRQETLPEEELPVYLCGYTPNFRREAGSAGKDTRGYIRQHQFNKVELVKICLPESSDAELEALTRDAEAVLEALGLSYRTCLLCSGDLGFAAAKCYDLEVWFPAQARYREISSCSNCRDFQARRASIKYKPADGGKPRFAHTLNGSGVAVGRCLAAVLENYQRPDGSVKIPDALLPYMGGISEIKPAEAASSTGPG